MHKKLLIILIVLGFIAASVAWLAYESRTVLAKGQRAKFQLPANAVQVADNVYSLGTAFDKKSGQQVEGFAIIHRKDGAAKSNGAKVTTTTCYGFLATGAKWKTVEPYFIDPTNDVGLNPTTIESNINVDINKWEDAANGVMNDGKSVNIIGDQSFQIVPLGFNPFTLNGYNQVYFAPISQSGVIAMTIVWGTFSAPINQRQLVEWDQIYSENFNWSISNNPTKDTPVAILNTMDFDDIATHELGHSVGMNDLYTKACSEQTMYGYASYGETKKRTLESGDIMGVNMLY